MQPKPMSGFILAKEKKQKDIINLGFDLPENYGANERAAGLCVVVDVGPLTPEQSQYLSEHDTYPEAEPGDIVAFAPFTDVKVTLGTEEWLFIEHKSLIGNFGKVEGKK